VRDGRPSSEIRRHDVAIAFQVHTDFRRRLKVVARRPFDFFEEERASPWHLQATGVPLRRFET